MRDKRVSYMRDDYLRLGRNPQRSKQQQEEMEEFEQRLIAETHKMCELILKKKEESGSKSIFEHVFGKGT
jgi:hypothetical protein